MSGDLGRRIARGTLVNGVGGVLGQAATFTTLIVALDRTGAEAYGVIVLAQGLLLLPMLFEKGVGLTIIRLTAGDSAEARRGGRLAAAIGSYFAIGVVTLVGGLAFSHWLLLDVLDITSGRSQAVRAFDVMVLAATIRAMTGFLPRVLTGATRLVALREVELVRDGTGLVCTLLLVGSGADQIVDVAIALLIGDVLAVGVAAMLVQTGPKLGARFTEVDGVVIAQTWKDARPMLALGLVGVISSRLDPLIVGIALGSTHVAVYGVVSRVLQTISGGTDLAFLGLTPATAQLLATGQRQRLRGLYSRAARYAATLVWPVAGAAAVVGPELAAQLESVDRDGFAGALVAAMLVAVLYVPVGGAWLVLYGADRTQDAVRRQVVGGVLSLVLSLALVNPLGVAGVFVGTLVSSVFVSVRVLGLVCDLASVSVATLLSGLVRPAVGAAVASAAVFAVRAMTDGLVPLAIGVAVVAVAYCGASLRWVVLPVDLARLRPAVPDGDGPA
jgi:O-antigen/teichoic acid export membrane protein